MKKYIFIHYGAGGSGFTLYYVEGDGVEHARARLPFGGVLVVELADIEGHGIYELYDYISPDYEG